MTSNRAARQAPVEATAPQERRLEHLIKMVRSLTQASEPDEALEVYADTMRKLYPAMGSLALSTEGLQEGQYRIVWQEDHTGRSMTDVRPFTASEGEAPVLSGGFLGDLIRPGVPRICHDFRVSQDPVLGEFLAPYRTAIAAPLYRGDKTTRWTILLDRRAGVFTQGLLEDVVIWENMLGAILQNIVIAGQLRRERDRKQTEIDRIASIQKALLPQSLPEIPRVRLAVSYETFDVAGGDIYDLHQIGSDSDDQPLQDAPWGIVVGDVSGHGPGAAVVMAMVGSLLRSCPSDKSDPGEVLAFINQRLCRRRIENSFVTAVVANYDPATLKMTYSCAGHPPIVRRRIGKGDEYDIARLEHVGGPPLGVLPDSTFPQAAVDLQTGDTLVFYTDGITEARSREGEFFGVDGIERALGHCFGDATCVVDTVMEDLKEHEEGGRPQDDQTLLAMEIL